VPDYLRSRRSLKPGIRATDEVEWRRCGEPAQDWATMLSWPCRNPRRSAGPCGRAGSLVQPVSRVGRPPKCAPPSSAARWTATGRPRMRPARPNPESRRRVGPDQPGDDGSEWWSFRGSCPGKRTGYDNSGRRVPTARVSPARPIQRGVRRRGGDASEPFLGALFTEPVDGPICPRSPRCRLRTAVDVFLPHSPDSDHCWDLLTTP